MEKWVWFAVFKDSSCFKVSLPLLYPALPDSELMLNIRKQGKTLSPHPADRYGLKWWLYDHATGLQIWKSWESVLGSSTDPGLCMSTTVQWQATVPNSKWIILSLLWARHSSLQIPNKRWKAGYSVQGNKALCIMFAQWFPANHYNFLRNKAKYEESDTAKKS